MSLTLVSQKPDLRQSIPALASDMQAFTLREDGSDDSKDLPIKPSSSKRKTLDEIKVWANQQSVTSVSFVIIGTCYVDIAHERARRCGEKHIDGPTFVRVEAS